ncbi:ATP-binding protein [Bradyrhizobium sp. AZCC 2289]|uniref:ATP-binding protein n=1 Tax=Bradyrhizobium sp. AZCC 2289 TaxID=3117026 RepID=UPI002FEEED6A
MDSRDAVNPDVAAHLESVRADVPGSKNIREVFTKEIMADFNHTKVVCLARELHDRVVIQNSFDSIQRAINELHILKPGEGLVEIELAADKNSLTIRDNGAGLSSKSAAEVLTRVGASGKSYRKNAGFRGIGRLAGIVFSDTVTFTTKTRGENEETTVVFNAKAMRAAMAPGKGSSKSAQILLKESVHAYKSPSNEIKRHYFQVKLDGFTDAPDECISSSEMSDFISQVAPVPFSSEFPFVQKIKDAAEKHQIPVEEVAITIKDGEGKPERVYKRYVSEYDFESGKVNLADCHIEASTSGQWWAWIGKKSESGAYTDPRVSGLRVRVRNIQIDGTEIVREIFREHAKSYVRFQDYYLGEIYMNAGALVPNARRDGFEEDAAWKKVRGELAAVVTSLGKEAYSVSTTGQNSVEAQRENLEKAKKNIRRLKKSDFQDADAAIKLSTDITKYQKQIAKGSQGADLPTLAEFQAIGAELVDIKREALARVGTAVMDLDRERVQQEARDEILREIMVLLEEQLSPGCYSEVREILVATFDIDADRA